MSTTPTPPTVVEPAGSDDKIQCPHCGSGLLWSDDRGAHCDGCDEFDPKSDLPGAQVACSAAFWWMPRRTDPMHSGWYYVRETQPRLCVGIRYFDDSNQTWWAVSKDGKNDGSLVPNEAFHDWLTIPNISDRQRS